MKLQNKLKLQDASLKDIAAKQTLRAKIEAESYKSVDFDKHNILSTFH